MLEKGKADVAFIQGGTANKEESKNLISLGSIYFEPLWIFYKKGEDFNYLYELKGKKFPFWMASMLDRLAIMIIPLITLLFPLFKGILPLYRWRVRKAIYKWYKILFK